jgi:transcriptional regulator with XRE-family HTH domain
MDAKKWAKIIALNARQVRLDAEMTQAEVAAKMTCQVPTISRIESGSHLPSLRTLVSLAEALGVTPCRFLQAPAE